MHVRFVEPGSKSALANPFLLGSLAAVGSALRGADLDMLVSHSGSVDPALHRSGLVDGYIQLGFGFDDSVLAESAEAGIPLAVWMPPIPDLGYCSVGVDNVELAREATAHLLALGRSRSGRRFSSHERRYREDFTSPHWARARHDIETAPARSGLDEELSSG